MDKTDVSMRSGSSGNAGHAPGAMGPVPPPGAGGAGGAGGAPPPGAAEGGPSFAGLSPEAAAYFKEIAEQLGQIRVAFEHQGLDVAALRDSQYEGTEAIKHTNTNISNLQVTVREETRALGRRLENTFTAFGEKITEHNRTVDTMLTVLVNFVTNPNATTPSAPARA